LLIVLSSAVDQWKYSNIFQVMKQVELKGANEALEDINSPLKTFKSQMVFIQN